MSHAIVTQDGATAVSLKLKATHTDHATDNQTRNKCNKQTNVVNKSCAFGVFSVGACTVPATFDIRFHRFWKPVSPYSDATESSQVEQAQLGGGTTARVNLEAAAAAEGFSSIRKYSV